MNQPQPVPSHETDPDVIIANLLTMDIAALKSATFEVALKAHPLLDAQLMDYFKTKKTKPLLVKPINTILGAGDKILSDALALMTLEGSQNLKRGSMVCVGLDDNGNPTQDVWQQSMDKLHTGYNIDSVSPDGWLTCIPRAGEMVNACQITEEDFGDQLGPKGGFSIVNPWWGDAKYVHPDTLAQFGIENPNPDNLMTEKTAKSDKDKENMGLLKVFLHYGIADDYVLQKMGDAIDVYRVNCNFYKYSYEAV